MRKLKLCKKITANYELTEQGDMMIVNVWTKEASDFEMVDLSEGHELREDVLVYIGEELNHIHILGKAVFFMSAL